MTPSPITLAIHGAAGRMGRRLIALAAESGAFTLAAAIGRTSLPEIDAGILAGIPALNLPVTASLPGTNPQVIIDFSAPAATRVLLAQCVARHIPILIGTTGLSAEDHALIEAAAKTIPVLQATNTSLGINVLLKIVAEVAQKLGPDYDIELVESHHNQKKDSPSGTAISLLESICAATGRRMQTDLVYGREGADCKRKPGTIGVHSLRMGDIVGEHQVTFSTAGERIEITHKASTRDTFAKGALRAAAWLTEAKPGRYTMKDVLGL